jgi:predicted MPP superfamily phosphohydrolase
MPHRSFAAPLLHLLVLHLLHHVPQARLLPAPSSSSPPPSSSFVFLADLHLGEGCYTSTSNYQLNDTNCYSVRDLNATIAQINALISDTSLVIVGGDLTASAQTTEFHAAREYLRRLDSPFIATIGNHDIWSYDQRVGDRTPTPAGDQLFSSVFHDSFVDISHLGRLTYPNTTTNLTTNQTLLHAQSWTFRPGPTFAPGLQALTFVAPDFNTRDKAPPPCPGHSPIGGCGVVGHADLNNVTNGKRVYIAGYRV